MKYIISTTRQPLVDNERLTFMFGAPFLALLRGDPWNETTGTVGRGTESLQSIGFSAIKPGDSTEYYHIKCLCEFGFTDTPMNIIQPNIESIPEESRTPLHTICLERMEGLSAEHLAMSVVQYADEVLTAPYFEIIEVA